MEEWNESIHPKSDRINFVRGTSATRPFHETGGGNYASILPMHSMLEADIRGPHFSTRGINFRYVCPIYRDIFIGDWF